MEKLKNKIKEGDILLLVVSDDREKNKNGLQIVTKVENKCFFVKFIDSLEHERQFKV